MLNGVGIVTPTQRFWVGVGWVVMVAFGIMVTVAILVLIFEQPPDGKVMMQ